MMKTAATHASNTTSVMYLARDVSFAGVSAAASCISFTLQWGVLINALPSHPEGRVASQRSDTEQG